MKFFKKLPLAIFGFFVFWLLFIKSQNSLAVILLNNRGVIFQLIPIVFLFIFLSLYFRNYINFTKIDIGSLLTTFGLMLTILFFMIQNSREVMSKIQLLQITTVENCELAKHIESLKPQDIEKGLAGLFSYEIYNQNYDFIINEFGDPKNFGTISQGVFVMKMANRINQKAFQNFDIKLSNELIDIAKEVHIHVCDKMSPVFLAKTEIADNSLASSIYKILKQYFLEN